MLLDRDPPEGTPRRELERDFAVALVEATPELRRIAGYYVVDADSAEDVVQATLLTAIERESSYDRQRPLVPWLAGILLNKIATLRRERRGRELEPERLLGPSSESVAASNEIERLVEEGLRQLPPQYRVVLELYLREGEQGAEIAARLKKPPGTVRAQIHRGLNRLRALLPASLALGTLFAFLGGRRASAAPAVRSPAPRAPRPGWPRSHPGLALSAGALALATGGIALSASLDAGRGPGSVASAATVEAAERPELEIRDARERRASLSEAPAHPAARPAGNAAGEVALHVFERDGRAPLAGVELSATVETRQGDRLELMARTDEDGNAHLDVAPADVERLTVRARGTDHAPHWSLWNSASTAFGAATLRIPLQRSRPIGGEIVDEAGRGIPGVLVLASITLLVDDELWLNAPEELVTRSDGSGRWSIADVPAATGEIHLRLAHPEYVSELCVDDGKRPAPEELWDGTSRIVLARGRPMALRVLDERGTPVPAASVRLLEQRDPPQIMIQLETDAAGRVEFADPDEERYIVQVRAPGFVPAALFLERGAAQESELRLRRGEPVEVQILDAQGNPAADAQARRFGSTWEEALATDEQGRLTLEIAPGRNALLAVRRPGVLASAVVKVSATQREARLPRLVHVRGAVRDASSGLPVERAELRLLGPAGAEIARLRPAGGAGFDFALYPWAPSFALEASAVGFRTELQPDLAATGDLWVEPRLQPTAALDLVLVDDAGAPADYAGLVVCRVGRGATLSLGRLYAPAGERKIFVRGDGHVRMNLPEGEYALAIVGKSGFAYVRSTELPADGRVRMTPFARLEGSGEPGEEVRAEPLAEFPGLAFDYVARVDERGHYQLRGLPGGLVRVRSGSAPGRGVVVQLEPGTRNEVVLP